MEAPWHDGALRHWSIAAMNHYYLKGEKFIYIMIVREHEFIKDEGLDNGDFWNQLHAQASAANYSDFEGE